MTKSEKKIVRRKLEILKSAEKSGNVSKTCCSFGISRTVFYKYKRNYLKLGLEGLKNLPPIHHSHPQTTPDRTINRILEIVRKNPKWGCHRISNKLRTEHISLSHQTVQNILTKNGLRTRKNRLSKKSK